MTAYDEAIAIAFTLNQDKWKLGAKLKEAIDREGRSVREFCLERDGNYDHEDTYSNYIRAVRFRELLFDVPEYMTLIKLPISYFYTAWRGLENGIDFELLIEWLLESFLADGSKVTVRRLKSKIDEATGKEKDFGDYVGLLLRLWKRMKPVVIGHKSALNVSESAKAQAIQFHMEEIERLICQE